MAKRRKILPARPSRDAFDDSLLIRSAESLGRMIGALQREIDAARQLAAVRAGTGRNGATGAGRSKKSDPEEPKKKAAPHRQRPPARVKRAATRRR